MFYALIYLIMLLAVLSFIELLAYLFCKKVSFLDIQEFPPINAELIAKYKTFDSELGWENTPDSSKIDKGNASIFSYSFDSYGARTNKGANTKHKITTYGDSYCFGREVNDDQTWQHFLGEIQSCEVSNFGVGNYGIDQSLLRMKRRYELKPAPIVILAITPYTIMRILSVWKHYSEPGNILAAKPKYMIQDNKLILTPNFIEQTKDFLNLKQYSDYLHKNDFHYPRFLKSKSFFPRTYFLLKNSEHLFRVFNSIKIKICLKIGLNKFAQKLHYKNKKSEVLYKEQLFREHEKLLKMIVEDFLEFSKEKNFKPIFLILPSLEDIIHIKNNTHFYRDLLTDLKSFRELLTLDFYTCFESINNAGDFFVDQIYGGHYNSSGNKLLANFLNKNIGATNNV